MNKRRAYDACRDVVKNRQMCYEGSGLPKGGEECLIEELEEKRCLSFQLCPREAAAYYGTLEGEKGLCSLWAESFAFTRDDARVHSATKEAHQRGSDVVMADKRKQQACRERVYNLSKALAKFSPFQ
jgi:hypothetical protein